MELCVALAMIAMIGCRSAHPRGGSTAAVGPEPVVVTALSTDEADKHPHIYISRQVVKPGFYTWSDGMTLTDAIHSAGGFTKFATVNHVKVIRRDNSVAGIYNCHAILSHRAQDPVLLPGDRIFVVGKESYFDSMDIFGL